MNKRQREVALYKLDQESAVLKQLERQYRLALDDVQMTIRLLQADEQTQSKIHRINYQKKLEKQLEGVLEKLHMSEYKSISEYLNDSYTTGYVGTMYDLHGQEVPLITPIDQNAAVKAIQLDTKLSDRKIHPSMNGEMVTLYESLGVDVDNLKKTIRKEITRGIASGMLYDDIARNISYVTKAPLSRAKTIVRTEGHRIQQQSAEDARQAAKARGADLVKQWDATLDGATRHNHRILDGKIVEVGERFKVGKFSPRFPGDFGDPAEDCNCRCEAVSVPRWMLDADELERLKERAAYFKLDKTADFADFEKKYLHAAKSPSNTTEPLKKQGKSGIIDVGEDPFYKGLSKEEIAARYKKPDGGNLLDESFLDMPIDIQREAVRAYDAAIELFGVTPPQRIKAAKLGKNVYGEYSSMFRLITISPTKNAVQGQAYATLIHEMTHHAENMKLFKPEAVLKNALKSLGLRSNSREADWLRGTTVGLNNMAERNKPSEIIAYAIERQMTGRGNPLTEAIYSDLKEKGIIK